MIEYLDMDKYFLELARHKVIFESQDNFRQFLFEYACQTCEFEGIDPIKARGYRMVLMKQKLHDILEVAQANYDILNYPSMIEEIDLDVIPQVVRREHMASSTVSHLSEICRDEAE